MSETKNKITISVPTMAELTARGETPDILFWVGCAGSFELSEGFKLHRTQVKTTHRKRFSQYP